MHHEVRPRQSFESFKYLQARTRLENMSTYCVLRTKPFPRDKQTSFKLKITPKIYQNVSKKIPKLPNNYPPGWSIHDFSDAVLFLLVYGSSDCYREYIQTKRKTGSAIHRPLSKKEEVISTFALYQLYTRHCTIVVVILSQRFFSFSMRLEHNYFRLISISADYTGNQNGVGVLCLNLELLTLYL